MNTIESTTTDTTMECRDRRRRTYRLDGAGQEHVTSCIGLAYWLAKRFARKYGLDREEAEGVAVEWLCKAAARFDPTRGFKFSTYAGKAVERALILFTDREYRHRRVQGIRFSEMGMSDTEDARSFDPADEKALPADHLPCNLETLQKIEARLPARLWNVLCSYYVEGLNLRQLGESLRISKERVRQLLLKAVHRARRAIEGPEDEPAPAFKAMLISKRRPRPAGQVEDASAEAYSTAYCPSYLIVCLLSTRGKPQSIEDITGVLYDQDPSNVKATIEELLRDGKIVEQDGRYRLA